MSTFAHNMLYRRPCPSTIDSSNTIQRAINNHDVFNWVLLDADREITGSTNSMANVLNGLQVWAVGESSKNNSDAWSLAQAVFEGLSDFTTDEDELQGMSDTEQILHMSKARVKEINGGRIARSGLKGIQLSRINSKYDNRDQCDKPPRDEPAGILASLIALFVSSILSILCSSILIAPLTLFSEL